MIAKFGHQCKKLYQWSQKATVGRILSGCISVVVWLALWHWAAASLNSPLLLPSPLAVIRRLGELGATAAFWQYSLRSLLRVVSGIVIGAALALLVAILTAFFPPAHTLLHPIISVIKSTPVASFIILAMLWLNEGILPVFIAVLMVFPIIWANLHTALRSIPKPYLEMARVFRLAAWRRVRRIYVPCVFPYFLSACESSLGLAWKAGIAAEVLALPARSIGKQLSDAKFYLETEDLFAWTLVVIVLSLLLERLAHLLFRRLWIRKKQAPADHVRKEDSSDAKA